MSPRNQEKKKEKDIKEDEGIETEYSLCPLFDLLIC